MRCPRCRAPLLALGACAVIADDLAARAVEAREELARMRLALPQTVPAALADAAARAPELARALKCHAGTCCRPASPGIGPENSG